MKSLFKAPIAGLLAIIARCVLRKYKPFVIMVTGSVGKTSTKDAIAAALSTQSYLRASEKSYNSEFGVPLTIIGAKNPWTNVAKWAKVFQEGIALLLFPSHYPKTLVLEVGADRPGDLARILRIATPDAVVVTRLPDVPVHVEAYTTPAAVREEEFAPAYALAPGAPLIISSQDAHAIEMAKNTAAHITLVGFSGGADVHLDEPSVTFDGTVPTGMEVRITAADRSYLLHARGCLGRPQILAPAAAFALATAIGMSPKDVIAGLETYMPPPGRARILRGINGSILIDDSYNASPAAAEEALGSLTLVPKRARRIALLGDMLELGRYSREEHERIGRLAAERVDMLVAVGVRSRAMAEAAIAAGMAPEHALAFDTALEAARAAKEHIKENDLVLIKGSQSIRMERAVEDLLADPQDTVHLVRQDREWKRKK